MTQIRLPTLPPSLDHCIIWFYNREYVGQVYYNDKAIATLSQLALAKLKFCELTQHKRLLSQVHIAVQKF
jgi:hypothetical protein